MAKTIKSNWVTNFWNSNPCFSPMHALSTELEDFSRWPDLSEYQKFLNTKDGAIKTASNHTLQIVQQDGKSGAFQQNYAPRIYLTGEVQTRTENWHDFFQVMTWRLFPLTKAVINHKQYHAANTRQQDPQQQAGARSKIENILSRFDECGAIIVYSDPKLADLILNHQWKELFWENKARFEKDINCFVFGHALYEKFFNPYIGMTANCILLQQEESFLSLPLDEQISIIDQQVAARLTDDAIYSAKRGLKPLPILGIPGWYADNQSKSFYDNRDYFRPRPGSTAGPD